LTVFPGIFTTLGSIVVAFAAEVLAVLAAAILTTTLSRALAAPVCATIRSTPGPLLTLSNGTIPGLRRDAGSRLALSGALGLDRIGQWAEGDDEGRRDD